MDDEPGLREFGLSVEAPGSNLAHAVWLETRVVLVHPSEDGKAIAASIPGCVLWEDRRSVDLEGLDSRFPTEWADFTTSAYPDDAAWALDWSPQDLGYSTLGAVRLLLNQKHPARELLRENPPSLAARVLWDAIRLDVAGQLIRGAFSDGGFVRSPGAFADGTLGATVRRMLRTYFPSESISTLAALAVRDPSSFASRLQASLGAYRAT